MEKSSQSYRNRLLELLHPLDLDRLRQHLEPIIITTTAAVPYRTHSRLAGGGTTRFASVHNSSAPYPSVSTAYLKLPSIVGNTAMTVPTSWSSAALSTFSPITNFDIENSLWNHRCDYISTRWLLPS